MIFNFRQKTVAPVKRKAYITNTNYKQEFTSRFNQSASVLDHISMYPTPEWNKTNWMYRLIPAVRAGVNKKASTLLATGWRIQDKNGMIQTDLTAKVEEVGKLRDLVLKASKQYDVYASVIYYYDTTTKGYVNIKCIPVSEIGNIYVTTDFKLKAFDWNGNSFFMNKAINDNFYMGAEADLDDQLFGAPCLLALENVLDGYLADQENYKQFLENGAFPGVFAMVADDIEQETIEELNSQLSSLGNKSNRYRASIIPGALDSEGRNLISFVTFKQNIENRLTQEEKEAQEGLVYDALLIPRKIMGQQTQGLGSDEYQVALLDYQNSCIRPRVAMLESDINKFVLPKILKYIEDENWFKENNVRVKIGNRTRIATAEDFYFAFNDIDLQNIDKKQTNYLEAYKLGAMSIGEMKVRAFNYRPSEIAEEEFSKTFEDTKPNYNKPNNDVTAPEQGGELLKTDIKSESARVRQSGKVKKSIKKFIEENGVDFSLIEPLTQSTKIVDIKNRVKKAISKQYMQSNLFDLELTGDESIEDIMKQITFPSASKMLSSRDLLLAMLYASQVAVMATETAYTIGNDEKYKIKVDVDTYVHQNINNMFGNTTKIPLNDLYDLEITDKNKEIADPYFDGKLDDTTTRDIATMALALLDDADITKVIDKKAEERARLIVDIAVASAFGFATFATGIHTQANKKQWLRTRASKPDATHLAQVGEIVDIDDRFTDGSYWSQSRFGCQCGIKLIK